LKIQCPQGRAGSTPGRRYSLKILKKTRFVNLVFLFYDLMSEDQIGPLYVKGNENLGFKAPKSKALRLMSLITC
ncbi:hypothetical protein KP766_00625, partial [Streptococcus equi subsp. equi]|uniref:hypothetical protein n=1 Tax=Streptococcus equi TaxID=1336 RepID=UPI001E32954A